MSSQTKSNSQSSMLSSEPRTAQRMSSIASAVFGNGFERASAMVYVWPLKSLAPRVAEASWPCSYLFHVYRLATVWTTASTKYCTTRSTAVGYASRPSTTALPCSSIQLATTWLNWSSSPTSKTQTCFWWSSTVGAQSLRQSAPVIGKSWHSFTCPLLSRQLRHVGFCFWSMYMCFFVRRISHKVRWNLARW